MAEPKGIVLRVNDIAQWNMLTDEQAGALVKALLRYGATGERIETTDGMLAMAFSFMATTIDRDLEQWRKTCERNAANARKRWEAKQASAGESMRSNATECERIQPDAEESGGSAQNAAEKPQRAPKRSARPTLEEVKAYCAERGNNVNPETFFDFYESKGWLVGKAPMKDWRAAVRTWERSRDDGRKKAPEHPKQNFEQSSFEASELESLVNMF